MIQGTLLTVLSGWIPGWTAVQAVEAASPEAAADPAADWARLRDLRRTDPDPPAGAAWGCFPLLGMGADTFFLVVAGTGIATLLIRGLQRYWEAKTRPFGSLEELNRLAAWAVEGEDEARARAAQMGTLFIKSIRETTQAFDQEYLQVPYTVDPGDWHLIEEVRHGLTARYLKTVLGRLQDFGVGIGRMAERDWGPVYAETFRDFSEKVILVAGPMTRWNPPPTDEDLCNLEAFQRTLRRELAVLESRLKAGSQAV